MNSILKRLCLFITLFFVWFSLSAQNWSSIENGVQNSNSTGGVKSIFAFKQRLFVASNRKFTSLNGNTISTCLVYWDNRKWRAVDMDSVETQEIEAFVVFRDTLYAFGQSSITDHQLHLLVYNCENDNWVKVPNSTFKKIPSGLHLWPWVFKAIEYNNEMYIVGKFDSVGGLSARNIVKWDGENWSNILDQIESKQITNIIEYNDQLIICGKIESINNEPYNNLARWNGSEWDNLNQGLITVDTAFIYWSVSELAVFNGILYAGGYRVKTIDNENSYSLNKFNGSFWEGVKGFEYDGTEIRSNKIQDLQVFGNRLFASKGEVGNTFYYDGFNTFKLDEVLNERITSFNVFNDELYGGGLFVGDGGPNGVAKLERLNYESTNEFKISFFPNPNQGKLFVNYELDKNSKLIIRVYNLNGRLELEKSFNDLKGKYLRQFDISNLAKGDYVIHFLSKSFEQSYLLMLK